jgi:trigger factor
MQVSLENLGKLARRMTVRIPADQVDTRVQERMAELGRTVRIKGFRPGKIPSKVIEQRFGAQVRDETMSDVIGNAFQEVVTREQLRPAVPPQMSARPERKDGEIEFSVTFEIYPELGSIDVSGLELNRVVASVEATDVDRMIDTLRQQRREWIAADRAAQPGDMVLFEYAAQTPEERIPAEGMERAATLLGSGAIFEDFEARLGGMKAGEQVSPELFFPANFSIRPLAGKQAKVELRVVAVQESRLPEVDDAFIASFGVREGGIEKFRGDVRQNLERELGNMLTLRNKGEAVGKLVGAHRHLEVPEGMVQAQARHLAQQARDEVERAGHNPDSVPSADQLRPAATERVLASLLLIEIARQHQIKADPRRVSELLGTIAQTYEDPAQVIEMYAKDRDLMQGLHERVREDQVIDWIFDHAKVTEQRMGFDEAMKRPGAA